MATTRSAILFIAGLGESTVDQTADGIATRIAHALDRNAQEVAAKFTVLPGANQTLSGEVTLTRATVERTGSTAALDVWCLATAGELTEDYEQSKLHVKLLRGARVVARYGRKAQILLGRGRPAKKARDRAQLWAVRAMIVLMGVYLLGLLATFVAGIAGMGWLPDWASTAVLGLTGLGIWQSKWVKGVASSAVQLNCLLDYIGEGESVNAFRGHVADSLQHFAEQTDVVYDQIDLVAYSFGSVVALDSVFPRADQPGTGFESVGTMVTIGCPYDLLTTYWPNYYKGRHRSEGVPKRWINVYSPRDLFGSDFLEIKGAVEIGIDVPGEAAPMRPDESIAWVVVAEDARDIQFWQILGFPGLKAHGHYWEGKADESVYSPLVRKLYEGTTLLA